MRHPVQSSPGLEVTMVLSRVRAVAAPVFLLAGLALAIAAPAAAQKPTFDIEGVVSDAQQGVLPGATVTLQNIATGLSREAATDVDRRYVFTALPPAGQYGLQAALAGLATQPPDDLQVDAGPRAVVS